MTSQEIEAIVGGYHGDPFHILGPHSVTRKKWEVRVAMEWRQRRNWRAERPKTININMPKRLSAMHATGVQAYAQESVAQCLAMIVGKTRRRGKSWQLAAHRPDSQPGSAVFFADQLMVQPRVQLQ